MSGILPILWFFLLFLTAGFFVTLSGADFGIGVLTLLARKEADRTEMMGAIGPLWYANETWLVISGAILFGAFPLAYSVLLSALYIPAIVLIVGLILRAVSIEFKGHAKRQRFWTGVFGAGSLTTVVALGFLVGGILSGISVRNGSFTGGSWDWFTVLSVVVALGTVCAFSMLGTAYLLYRTTDLMHDQTRRYLYVTSVSAFVLIAITLAILPALNTPLRDMWSSLPRAILIPVLFVSSLSAFFMLLRSIRRNRAAAPFRWSIVVFLCWAAGIVVMVFPYLIPSSISITDAASPEGSLKIMLFGVAVVIPLIIVYDLYVRRVFNKSAD